MSALSLRSRRVRTGGALGIAVGAALVLLLSHGSGSGDTGSNRPLSVEEVRRAEQPPPHQLLAEFATNPRLHAAYVARRLRGDGVPPRGLHPAEVSCTPIGPPLFMCRAALTKVPAAETNLYLLAYYEPSSDQKSIWFIRNGTGAPNFPCDGSLTGQLSLDRRQCVDIVKRYGFRSAARSRR
jgi:hypothetical protein